MPAFIPIFGIMYILGTPSIDLGLSDEMQIGLTAIVVISLILYVKRKQILSLYNRLTGKQPEEEDTEVDQ